MSEYMKKKQAVQPTQAKKTEQLNPMPQMTGGIPNSVLTDVFAGKRHADSSMMGHSQNLAPSIAAKMSRAFGMDLTGMQVYRSGAMSGTGMQGMAQGNKVVLSSDVDLNTTAGQAVLGHEISHIHAQSQGVGMGHSGLHENAALEHQADTEGLLAAQGRSIYSDGMDTGVGMSYGFGMQGVEGLTSLSGGMSASAGAPMQAKKDDTMKVNTGLLKEPGKEKTSGGGLFEKMENARMGFLKKQFGISDEQFAQMKPRKKTTQLERIQKLFNKGKKKTPSPVNPTFDEPTVLPNLEDIKSDADPLGTEDNGIQGEDEVLAGGLNNQQINEVQSNEDIAKRLEKSSTVENADLRDFDPEFAKEFNNAFADAKKDFPDLKMNYCGTVENQIEGIHHIIADEYEKALRAKNGDKIPDEVYKKMASEYADGEVIRQKLIDDRDVFGHSLQMPEGPYSKFNGIAISKKYASNNDFFNKEKEKETDSKHKPVGCNTSKATVDHELGHEIDHMVNASNDKFINELYDQFMKEEKPEEKLSGYAKTNVAEFIAEGYSEYRNNPTPRDYATQIYNRLKELDAQRGKH